MTFPSTPSPREATVALILFTVAVCLRLPAIVEKGRFFGEEASFFFAYAWHMPWRMAVFRTLGGYLNIVASATSTLDAWLVRSGALDLRWAPYVTEVVALAFQLCPAILIMISRAPWLDSRFARYSALGLIATVALCEEVWLNSLHSQFHLTLCTALILTTDAGGGAATAAFRLALLLIAPLSGPGSIALAPLFLCRGLVDRSRDRWLQAGTLAFGALIQLVFFYEASSIRSHHANLGAVLDALFVRHLILPWVGPIAALAAGREIFQALTHNASTTISILLSESIWIGLTVLAVKYWRRPAAWLYGAGATLALLPQVGGLGAGPSFLSVVFAERYTFAPNALFGLAIVALTASTRPTVRGAGVFATLWLLYVNLSSLQLHIANLADGPDWRVEVSRWRADPNYQLQGWPSDWRLDLSSRAPMCAPYPGALDSAAYCNSSWERRQRDAAAPP